MDCRVCVGPIYCSLFFNAIRKSNLEEINNLIKNFDINEEYHDESDEKRKKSILNGEIKAIPVIGVDYHRAMADFTLKSKLI
jgi:hypothetical protein